MPVGRIMTMHSLQNCSLDIIMKISVIATVTLLSLLALASSAPGHHYQLDQLKNALQQQYHSGKYYIYALTSITKEFN